VFCGLADFCFEIFFVGVVDDTVVQGTSCTIIIIISNNSFEHLI
jgi:hypothetical protein